MPDLSQKGWPPPLVSLRPSVIQPCLPGHVYLISFFLLHPKPLTTLHTSLLCSPLGLTSSLSREHAARTTLGSLPSLLLCLLLSVYPASHSIQVPPPLGHIPCLFLFPPLWDLIALVHLLHATQNSTFYCRPVYLSVAGRVL